MFQTNVVDKKTETCILLDNMEKHCSKGQTADDSMAHAHCRLDT